MYNYACSTFVKIIISLHVGEEFANMKLGRMAGGGIFQPCIHEFLIVSPSSLWILFTLL
jgi:hypothetical protein